MKFEYYKIGNESLQRLKVPGGWLVSLDGYRETSLCFYPDPNHGWVVNGKIDSNYQCPACKGYDLRKKTELNKSLCYRQYGTDNSLFCYNCLSDELKEILDNPRKDCDNCPGTMYCPHPYNGKGETIDDDDDIDDHTSVWGGAGPDCIIERLEAAGESGMRNMTKNQRR